MDKLPAGTQLPQDKDDDNKRAQEEQMRRDLLATVLDTAARERCASASIFNVLDI
jgi:programmed cell death protein 5